MSCVGRKYRCDNPGSRVINRGLIKTGRNYAVTIDLSDKPGVLAEVSDIIGKLGGNIISVTHERISVDTPITSLYAAPRNGNP